MIGRRATLPILALSLTACNAATSDADQIAPYDGITLGETISLTGTEPFWGGTIADGQMTYTTPENIDGSTFPVERFAGNSGLGFRGELNGEPVQVAVTPGVCSDAMSDRSYPFTATLSLAGELREGCAYTDRQPFTGPEAP